MMVTKPRAWRALPVRSGLLAAAAAVALAAGACGSPETAYHEDSGGIEMVLEGNAIVELQSITRVSEFEILGISNVVYELEIGQVVSFAVNPANPESPKGPPGGTVRAFEAVTGSSQFVLDDFGDGKLQDRVLAILDWSSDSLQAKEAGTRWNLQAAMIDEGNGSLRFLGVDAELFNSEFDAMRAVGSGLSDERLLVAALKEVVDGYGKNEVGPLLAATRPSAGAGPDWYSLPIEERPLDPEIAPAGELDDLSYRMLLIEVAEDARTASRKIKIVSSRGISYSGTLDGNRQASMLVPPDGDFELIISSDSIEADRISIDRDTFLAGQVTYLEVGGGAAGAKVSAAEILNSLRPLDIEKEAREILQRWAVDGLPSPEPEEDEANVRDG